MANLHLLINAWDEAIREFSLVFEGLADEDVWKRPHPSLLSVGELTAHVAYYEAVMTNEPAGPKVHISSPLVKRSFSYYPTQVRKPVQLDLTAEGLLAELTRIHDEAKAAVLKVDRDSEDLIAGRKNATWGAYLQYLGFHAAYHGGQAYSVRHLLGHTPSDN